MQRGIRRRGGVPAGTVESGDLPGEGSAERDPERIAVRGLEGPALVPTSLTSFREMADVFCEDLFFLQASDDVRYGVRLDRDHEGPFADRVQRVHAEDLRDRRDGRIHMDSCEIHVDSESGGLDRKSTRLNSSHVK